MQIIWLSHQWRTILLLQCTHTWKGGLTTCFAPTSPPTHTLVLVPCPLIIFVSIVASSTFSPPPSTSYLVCSNILVGGGCGWLYCTSLWCLDLIEPKLAFTFTSTCSFLAKTLITPKHDFHDLDNLQLLSNYNHVIIFRLQSLSCF